LLVQVKVHYVIFFDSIITSEKNDIFNETFNFNTSGSLKSCTTNSQVLAFDKYIIYDTPGLLDTSDQDYMNMYNFINEIKKYNGIIICVDISRDKPFQKECYRYIIELFYESFQSMKFCVVINKIDSLPRNKYNVELDQIITLTRKFFDELLIEYNFQPNYYPILPISSNQNNFIVKKGVLISENMICKQSIETYLNLKQWLSQNNDQMLLEDKLYPLPPQYEIIRRQEILNIEKNLIELTKLIDSFNSELASLQECVNKNDHIINQYKNSNLLMDNKKHRLLNDNIIDIVSETQRKWFNSNNVILEYPLKSKLINKWEVLSSFWCDVEVAFNNNKNKIIVTYKPRLLTLFYNYDSNCNWSCAIKLLGDPEEIHKNSLSNINTEIIKNSDTINNLIIEKNDFMEQINILIVNKDLKQFSFKKTKRTISFL